MSSRHPSEPGCMFTAWFIFCAVVVLISIGITIWLAVAGIGWLGRH